MSAGLRRCGRRGLIGHIQIEIAVVIVINEGDADASFFPADAYGFGDLVELAVSFVVQQVDAIAQTYGQIGVAIVVEVAGGTTQPAAGERDP